MGALPDVLTRDPESVPVASDPRPPVDVGAPGKGIGIRIRACI